MFRQKKHLLLFILICFQSSIILAQNIFVSNVYNNLIFTNPSYVLYNNYSIVQLNYRNQWPVANMFTSYGASYFHNAPNLNSNFGAILFYDNQYKGVFTNLGLGLNYGYKMQIARKAHLLFGLQGFYNFSATHTSKLTFENQTGTIPVNQQSRYPLVKGGLGLLLNDNHFIGVSIINSFQPVPSLGNNLMVNASYTGLLSGRNYYSDIYFEPIIMVSTNLQNIGFQYGGNIRFSGIKTGLLLHQTGVNINTFIILLGISFENYEFVYTYDLNLSGAIIINPKMAAHEVTFLKKFQYKGKNKRHKAIKCPDILL